ncbi:MAG TPA: CAP domain-containing protein [Candidatus Angelobacter sp.]|jgi:uncharacterized protein YkwD|nr:CAP domain-containing protein [Candidatus Angelobacter sp.]
MKKILLIILLLLGMATAFAQTGLSQDESRLLTLLNQERQKAGLSKLQWDSHLAESARLHTQKLVEHQELSHQFSGEPPLGERAGATGLRFNSVAENVAMAPTIDEIHKGFMNSPPHRANILSPKYNSVGFGIALSQGELYVTQNFANVLPTYSVGEFRDAVISAFNKVRRSNHVPEIDARPDDRLDKAACTANVNPNNLIHDLPGVTDLVIFTSSVPEKLPSHMQEAAGERTYRRMNIGVCFKPSPSHGFGSFYVVAAFYPLN